MSRFMHILGGLYVAAVAAALHPAAIAQQSAAAGGAVTASFAVGQPVAHAHRPNLNDIVLWLTPLDAPATPPAPRTARLAQKDKEFHPHLLVVPTGSSVEFPNLDPFFHNVFSLFDGKRFDLGLYEAGATRTVRFDREGVSYIFCNIHPQMGAVIVTLSSPYYGVSGPDGAVQIAHVPPGRYAVHVWNESLQPQSSADQQRTVVVGASGANLGTLSMVPVPSALAHHKNKFGEDYPVAPKTTY